LSAKKDRHRFAPLEVSGISSQSPRGGTTPYPLPGYGSALEVFLPNRVLSDIRIGLFDSSDPLLAFYRRSGFSEISDCQKSLEI
jgi:hypothetical protein